MVRSFYNQSVTRSRAQTADDGHGNAAPDWTLTPSTTTITGCRLQPLSADEIMENRFESDVRFRLLAPYGSDVTFLDRVTVAATVYEVAGAPLSHNSPSGAAQHDEILLRRVTG
jgi:hypothetical protein